MTAFAPLDSLNNEDKSCTFNNPESKPVHITFKDGQPIDEWIAHPELTPLPLEEVMRAEKEAQQKKREEQYHAPKRVAHTLSLYGPNGKPHTPSPPERNWSSRRPNENYLNAFVSGRYGTAQGRECRRFRH